MCGTVQGKDGLVFSLIHVGFSQIRPESYFPDVMYILDGPYFGRPNEVMREPELRYMLASGKLHPYEEGMPCLNVSRDTITKWMFSQHEMVLQLSSDHYLRVVAAPFNYDVVRHTCLAEFVIPSLGRSTTLAQSPFLRRGEIKLKLNLSKGNPIILTVTHALFYAHIGDLLYDLL